MRRRRPFSLLLALLLLAGASVALTPSAAFACGGVETLSLKTFHLEVQANKKVYKIGETANIKVTVTRPAEEDPLGNGIPMERPYVEPAPDVNIGVGLAIGRVFLPGAGITDENGVAIVRIKIERYAPRNQWADASAYAWKVLHEMPCATVQEDGFRMTPQMFRTASA